MKKLVTLMLILAMVLCLGMAFATETEGEAAAEQTGAAEINWADLEEKGAEMIAKGDFVTFDEIDLKMWIPKAMPAVELTDEDKSKGYIGYYRTEDGSATIAVMYVNVNGMTLEEYKEKMTQAGATELQDVVINGMEGVSYELKEKDTVGVSFVTEAGYIFEVVGAPKSDEGFAAILPFVMASIQAK